MGVVKQRGAGCYELFVQVLGVWFLGAFVTDDGADKFGALSLRVVFGQQIVAQTIDTGAVKQG